MEFRGKSERFSVSLRAFLQKLGFYFKTEIETTLWHIEEETDVAQISFWCVKREVLTRIPRVRTGRVHITFIHLPLART